MDNSNAGGNVTRVEILIVEDSPSQAERLGKLLTSEGYAVRLAENGKIALEEARRRTPRMIISDIGMPVMDGYELCRQLRQDPNLRDMPVILLTALNNLHDVVRSLECGADNFIRKPFEDKYLLGRIRFILANRDLRHDERTQLAMRVRLGGTTHLVTAERQQIFDMLISTYEEAVQMTEELRAQQERLARSYQSLEGLYRVAESLNPALTPDAVLEAALDRALDLPDVNAARVLLRTSDGQLHEAASRSLDPSQLPGPLARWLRLELQASSAHLGVLELLCGAGTCEEHLHAFRTLANQVAIALERAGLYANMEELVLERTQELERKHDQLSAVLQTSGALVLVIDDEGRIEMFNPACERTFGYSFEEVRNRHFWDVAESREKVDNVVQVLARTKVAELPLQSLQEVVVRDGSTRHVIWSTAALKRGDGHYYVCTGLDVTERREAEEQVRFLSNFDVTTGFANRSLLGERFAAAREEAAHAGRVLGLFVVHFPRLLELQQTLGTQAESSLLLQIAGRLRKWSKADEQRLARLDEITFAVLAERDNPDELAVVAGELASLFVAPAVLGPVEVHLAPFLGITVSPNDGDQFDELATAATTAMRTAMAEKAGQYAFYKAEFNRAASKRLRMESELRRALSRDEFLLHYQPQVSVSTGTIVGMEALVRWRHPRLGLLAPGEFIGMAEDSGLILPLGEWVLEEACQQNSSWLQQGLPVVPVHVNLSAKQFSADLVRIVKGALDRSQLPPSLLALELTESLSMEDPEQTISILRSLKDMGLRLAIDDFGTGYSNLAYLKKFPVDRLKLDRSFVKDLHAQGDDMSISRAVIDMAHSLQLKVTAEGVETDDQLRLLRANGCDEVQGFLMSRPVAADACPALLSAGVLLPEPPTEMRMVPGR